MTRLWLIAGEASGDNLGGRLMLALRELEPSIQMAGIGGEQMQQAGLNSLFAMDELSLMGFFEILPHLPRLRRRLRQTVQAILSSQPDTVVTIDSPGFCFRIAQALRLARAQGQWQGRLIHYVAPSVWAWKPKRAVKVARLYNALLCLLPFEPPYFTCHGLATHFVGHSILESPLQAVDTEAYCAQHGLQTPSSPPLLVLPGSRRTEINRLLPIFLDTARLLGHPPLLMPTLPPLIPTLRAATADYPQPVIITTTMSEKYAAMRVAGRALAASGTVSLELALAGTPMVIAYRVNPLSAAIARQLITVRYASLMNILADKPLIPEYLQERCTAQNLAKALQTLRPQADSLQPYLAQLQNSSGLPPSMLAAKIVLGKSSEFL